MSLFSLEGSSGCFLLWPSRWSSIDMCGFQKRLMLCFSSSRPEGVAIDWHKGRPIEGVGNSGACWVSMDVLNNQIVSSPESALIGDDSSLPFWVTYFASAANKSPVWGSENLSEIVVILKSSSQTDESQTIHSFGGHHQHVVGADRDLHYSLAEGSVRKFQTWDPRIYSKSTWLLI